MISREIATVVWDTYDPNSAAPTPATDVRHRNAQEWAAGNVDIYVGSTRVLTLISLKFPALVARRHPYRNGTANLYPDPPTAAKVAAFIAPVDLRGVKSVVAQCAAGGWWAWKRGQMERGS